MKTMHCSLNANMHAQATNLLNALHDRNIFGNYRIIQCGAGLVVLPETDMSKDATEGEVIKALGFRNKAEPMPKDDGERSTFAVSREGECRAMVSLTPSQVRFLRWCQAEDVFWDEIDFSAQRNSVIEI